LFWYAQKLFDNTRLRIEKKKKEEEVKCIIPSIPLSNPEKEEKRKGE